MTWFKVDDGLAFHPKAIIAGNAALGLWVRAGSWAASNLTDGRVPAEIWRTFGRIRDVRRLETAGLWVPDGCGDYRFHQWEEWQPTRDEVEKRRRSEAERKRRWREQRAELA